MSEDAKNLNLTILHTHTTPQLFGKLSTNAMLLLRIQINTELVEDCFIIPLRDKDTSIKWLLSEILRKYDEWHPFKVYEFEIDEIDEMDEIDFIDSDNDKLLNILNISEKEFVSNNVCKKCIIFKMIESDKSILHRKDDELKEEELRLERLRIEREKKEKRESLISHISLIGNCWELSNYSQFLSVPLESDNNGQIVINTGSLDQWSSIRFITAILPSFNKFYFSIKIVSLPSTTNTWKICIGAVPIEFKIDDDRHWIGSQHSWSYISGTGGKCYNSGKSINYGESYKENDIISVLLNFENNTIEFFKNGRSQGIAFKNLKCAVIPAVSLTAKQCKLKLINFLNDKYLPSKYKPFMIKNVEIIRNYIKQRQYYLSNKFELLQTQMIADKININQLYPRFSSYHYPESLYFKSTDKICNIVTNIGSGDKWRIARSFGAYYPDNLDNLDLNLSAFEFEIINDAKSTNAWRICCGVIPIDFNSSTDKIWCGAQSSWSYIAGTGGKCFNSSQSTSYGERYTTSDKISVLLDFNNLSIEFFKNGECQGIAYNNCQSLISGVYAAVSLTASGSCIKFNYLSKLNAKQLKNNSIKQRELLSNIINKYGNIWDSNKIRKYGLNIIDKIIVSSSISLDDKLNDEEEKWHCIGSLLSYQSGRRYFEIEICSILSSSKNTWKICIGVVPKSFNFNNLSNKLWIGAQNSWSLIIGNGGKCYNTSKYIPYTNETFNINDRIGVLMDFDNHTLEFYKNNKCLGQAFNNLYGPVYAAVSISINNCCLKWRTCFCFSESVQCQFSECFFI